MTPAEIAAKLRPVQVNELAALMNFNDETGKPCALWVGHWDDKLLNYCAMAEAGVVRRYARPPSGWSAKRFFGAKITPAGRAVLALLKGGAT